MRVISLRGVVFRAVYPSQPHSSDFLEVIQLGSGRAWTSRKGQDGRANTQMLPAASPPPASPSRSNSALPPDPPPSVIRTQAHPEHLLCLPPGPKRKSHIWRPEHQKFIEFFTFPKAQLATHTAVCGGVSPALLLWPRSG